MSGDQLDLDALDAAYALGGRPTLSEGIALVAEVRRLRADMETMTENMADALTESYDRGHSDALSEQSWLA